MSNNPPAFARFFRAVEGKIAARYGTATATTPNLMIGARRKPDGSGLEWNTVTVHAITQAEAIRFSREYDRAVREGALVEVKEAEYKAQLDAKKEAREKVAKAAAAAADVVADAINPLGDVK